MQTVKTKLLNVSMIKCLTNSLMNDVCKSVKWYKRSSFILRKIKLIFKRGMFISHMQPIRFIVPLPSSSLSNLHSNSYEFPVMIKHISLISFIRFAGTFICLLFRWCPEPYAQRLCPSSADTPTSANIFIVNRKILKSLCLHTRCCIMITCNKNKSQNFVN